MKIISYTNTPQTFALVNSLTYHKINFFSNQILEHKEGFL